MRIPTYLDVLNEARTWRATNTREALLNADEILRKGMEEFDDALPLGDERVLVLKGLGDLDQATQLLRELERTCRSISAHPTDGQAAIQQTNEEFISSVVG